MHWLATDVRDFRPPHAYALWHDRAAFHFLTTAPDVDHYLALARAAVAPGGYLLMGTFSPQGPTSCSGLPIRQYSESQLAGQLQQGFQKLRCRTENHRTPFQTTQNFLFCSFRRQPGGPVGVPYPLRHA